MSSGAYTTRLSYGRRDGPRDILRSQDKLKAEQDLGIKRQRKLKQSETYDAAPPGYVFMPLGTPELADYCKNLSQQQGYPIHVVNAKPASQIVRDPSKISHHVQRIGYHFKDSVVEEACTQLHYMISGGRFVSETDLKQHSLIARVMAKHGLQAQKLSTRETPEQLRAAIRELFPAIPNVDLDEVVKHAWDKNEARVGTASNIDLSRRIQLAVLARIRHTYTDYDVLLKTFDWVYCRKEVEPVCLKKLLEWRGETASDEGLEEIIAETMLLDEQSDAPRRARKSGGRRVSGYDTAGDASDASIEVSHHVAVAHDLRPESPYERNHGYFSAQRAPVQSYAERHDLARAKIQAARANLQYQSPPKPTQNYAQYQPVEQVDRIHVPTDGHGQAPSQIMIGGKVLRRASPEQIQQRQHVETYAPVQYRPMHGAPAPVQQAMQYHTAPPQSMPQHKPQPMPQPMAQQVPQWALQQQQSLQQQQQQHHHQYQPVYTVQQQQHVYPPQQAAYPAQEAAYPPQPAAYRQYPYS